MRLSQRRGAFLKRPSQRVTGIFRTRSSLLRGGGGEFSVVSDCATRNSGLNWALAAVASRLCFCLWGFGSLLFDNCIGRKRDVGGGVLAGLRLSGGILSASLEPARGLESEETTDGHVSKIHRASKECVSDRREAGRPQSFF